MDLVLNFITTNLGKFFSMEQLALVLTLDGILLIITLAFMEGMLSVDNAITLGAKVKPLPENQRKKALLYGIWGAYISRFLMIGFGTYLMQFMWIKAVGALYLLYMCIHGLLSKEEEQEEKVYSAKNFWWTVASVEALDIVFSLDSVTAALALSDEVWVLMVGSMLGILMMRGVAQYFVKLLTKVPELNKTAFVLIGIIGVKLGLTLIEIEISSVLTFVVMAAAFGATFIIHNINKKKVITA